MYSLSTLAKKASKAGYSVQRGYQRYLHKGWGYVILLFLPTLCTALTPGILPKSKTPKQWTGNDKYTAGRLGDLPSFPVLTSVLPFKILRPKLFSATIAHKGRNTAFQSFGGARMPPSPIGGSQTVSQGLTRVFPFWGCGPGPDLWLLTGRKMLGSHWPIFGFQHFLRTLTF